MVSQFIDEGTKPKFSNKSYFSDDDGKTWYIDDARNIPPYDHNGRVAYRAVLFKCEDGKVFVGRLERFDDASRDKILKELKDGTPPLVAQFQYNSRIMVKRPGEASWAQPKESDGAPSATYLKLMRVECKDGRPARPVSPDEVARPGN
jgi:hypothetical protein